ncbi:MAG: hypothetical protein ACYCT7_03865 [bacterium]
MIKTKIKIISVLLFAIIFLYLPSAYAAQSYAVSSFSSFFSLYNTK